MKILSFISLIAYIIFLFFNLYNKYIEKKSDSAFFKVLLMPVLCIFYFSSFRNFSILVVLALFFSWLGDIFLIKTKMKDVLFGIFGFSLAHIFYIFQLTKLIEFKNLNYIFISVLIVLYFGLSIFVSMVLKEYATKILKKYTNVIFIYSSLLSLLSIFSILVGLNSKFLVSVYLILGSNLFMLSDSILSYNLFVKREKITDILVMLTYGLAQLFIVLGFGNLI